WPCPPQRCATTFVATPESNADFKERNRGFPYVLFAGDPRSARPAKRRRPLLVSLSAIDSRRSGRRPRRPAPPRVGGRAAGHRPARATADTLRGPASSR